MPLQSEFRKNAQLIACAERDQAHVGRQFNATGDHVKLIRKALNVWIDREAPSPKPLKLDENANIYDDKVAKAVSLYKSTKRILNFRGQIDDIVGIKTVDALDKELPVEIDPIDIVSTFMDVIVKFQGTLKDSPQALKDDGVFPSTVLSSYLTSKIVPGRRKLVRIGHETNGIGSTTQSIRKGLIDRINAELEPNFALSNVFVFGSSSGGRNAIEFSNEFVTSGGKVSYLAVTDPAFFPQDTTTVPDDVPNPTNIPVFQARATAALKKNFFQTAGNESERRLTLSRQKIFVSQMAFKEIHGEIAGFIQVDLTKSVAIVGAGLTGRERADNLHIECSKQGSRRIQVDIAGVLNGLP